MGAVSAVAEPTRGWGRLTPHPFQRTGTVVVAQMAGKWRAELSREDFDEAAETLCRHYTQISAKQKGEPGYWWRWQIATNVFPNSGPFHHAFWKTKDDDEARRYFEEILGPPSAAGVEPCFVCGDPADRSVAKPSFPLAGAEYCRNTSPPGVDGWPLCWPCRVAVWAMPFGTLPFGAGLAVVDCDDPDLLESLVRKEFETLAQLIEVQAATKLALTPHRTMVISMLRGYGRRHRGGVRLLVVKNGNQSATVVEHRLDTATVDFVCGLAARGLAGEFDHVRHATADVKGGLGGGDRVAASLFDSDRRMHDFLRLVKSVSSPDAPNWGLASSYTEKVENVKLEQIAQVRTIGDRVAKVIAERGVRGPFHEFVRDAARRQTLVRWFRKAGVDWQLRGESSTPLLTIDEFELLFGDGWDAIHARELLFFAALEALHNRGWGQELSDDDREQIAAAAAAESEETEEG